MASNGIADMYNDISWYVKSQNNRSIFQQFNFKFKNLICDHDDLINNFITNR